MAYVILFAALIMAMVVLNKNAFTPRRTELIRIPLDSSFIRQKNR